MDNRPVILAALPIGEWATAGAGLGVVFVGALLGVLALGYWVIRGDRRNRELDAAQASETSSGQSQGH